MVFRMGVGLHGTSDCCRGDRDPVVAPLKEEGTARSEPRGQLTGVRGLGASGSYSLAWSAPSASGPEPTAAEIR